MARALPPQEQHGLGGPLEPYQSPRRILLVATRDVGGRTTGRIQVLRTHLDALASLGHAVTVAVVSPHEPADTAWSRRFRTVHVPAPGAASVVRSAGRTLLTRTATLNEALFVDRRVRRRIADLVAGDAFDAVVLDSLRLMTATDLVRPALPTVIDLDDLLSVRYERMRSEGVGDPAAVLGFASDRVPGPARELAARTAIRLLGWEARRVASRELAAARSAASTVSLVSRDEVDALQQRSGSDVAWLPPSVTIPERAVQNGDGLVFLGGLDYQPNVQALRLYRDEVLPHLDVDDPRQVLHVIGHVPDRARDELQVPGIVLHGFVRDLSAALSRTLLIAPLAAGGGVKLKVLDGMAHGLPVVGLPGAFEGLGLPTALRIQAENAWDMATLIRELLDAPERRADLGRAGRAFIEVNFSPAAAADRWQRVLAHMLVEP